MSLTSCRAAPPRNRVINAGVLYGQDGQSARIKMAFSTDCSKVPGTRPGRLRMALTGLQAFHSLTA